MSKIFTGLTLCCTAIDPDRRDDVAHKWENLGGVHTLDLIQNVTHLVVGSFDTDKYKFAVKNRPDITLLSIESVTSIYQRWLQGESITCAELLKYTLPIFNKLQICVTNISSSQRVEIQKIITNNGGTYCPDLTKSVDILLAPDKSGRKYSYAISWNVKVLHPNWLYKSLDKGAVQDYSIFNLDLVSDAADNNNIIMTAAAASGEAHHQQSSMMVTRTTLDHDKISRQDVIVSKKRKKTNSSRIFDDILSRVDKVNVNHQQEQQQVWDEKSNNSAFQLIQQDNDDGIDTTVETQQNILLDKNENVLFSNLRFYCLNFSEHQQRILDKAITSNGGEIISHLSLASSSSLPPHYCIINSYDLEYDYDELLKKFGNNNNNTKIVTEWFIERCLYKNIVIDASSDIWSQPTLLLNVKKLPLFEKLTFVISGFSGIELTHMQKLIQRLGGNIVNILNKSTGILIAIPGKSNRIKFAHKWNVPVFDCEFIWNCAKNGKIIDNIDVINLTRRADELASYHDDDDDDDEKKSGKRFFSEFDFTVPEPVNEVPQTSNDNDKNQDSLTSSSSSTTVKRSRSKLIGRRRTTTAASCLNSIESHPIQQQQQQNDDDVVETQLNDTSSQSTVSYAYPIAQREKKKMLRKLGEIY